MDVQGNHAKAKQLSNKRENYTMKNILTTSAIALALTAASQAAVTTVSSYRLGEGGSITGSSNSVTGIVDAQGARSSSITAKKAEAYTHAANIFAAPRLPSNSNVNSTQYIAAVTGGGFQLPSAGLANNNYGISVWVLNPNSTFTSPANFFSTGTNGLNLGYTGTAFSATAGGVSVGNSSFSGVTDKWFNVAVIQKAGQAFFFVNGQQINAAGITNTAANDASFYLGAGANGSGTSGDWLFDEARIVTFDATDSNASILTAMTVPEPSVAILGGLGALALLRRRRA